MLNDLWEFNPTTDLWTWMGGSSTVPNDGSNSEGQFPVYGYLGVQAATNMPGGRRSPAGWTDGSGNFWLFGGFGCEPVHCGDFLNDLWEYSPSAPVSSSSFSLSVTPASLSLLNTVIGVSGTATVTTTVAAGVNCAIALGTEQSAQRSYSDLYTLDDCRGGYRDDDHQCDSRGCARNL